ncbi:hypothetical protein ACP4OV_007370 [Aristida adscensionis]
MTWLAPEPDAGVVVNGNLIDPLIVVRADGHGSAAAKKAGGGGHGAEGKYWVAADKAERQVVMESGGEEGGALLYRTYKVKAALLYAYRTLILIRLLAVFLFITWRIKHNNTDVMWFWVTSVIADVWFSFSWLLYQLPKFNPIKRIPDLATLRQHYYLADGTSILPGIDVFVTTADPIDEPILYTMNCVLSILAADYPVDRYACYLSDDSGSLILYEALVEATKFASLWVPFCRKHSIEPRAPESYFLQEGMVNAGRSSGEFVKDYKHVQREYEELKMVMETLPCTIMKRSSVYNSMKENEGGPEATWMANGMQWPGTWVKPTHKHSKRHHDGIIQIVQDHPCHKLQQGLEASSINIINFGGVDARLPMVIYMSREKNPSYEHNKKAGALNTLLRISAQFSNSPFVINFDCDHYINNSQALHAAMCFLLDSREGDSTAFVQFPQRFENVDPTDRYGNHNRVFFDGAMYALNGMQGPPYVGTGCLFRRIALYGIDPPRFRPDDIAVDSNKFGNSISFLNSVVAALKHGYHITSPKLDEACLAEMKIVLSSSYDIGTEWGRGVGYIYEIATEDMVTGFRIHGQGWHSMYPTMEPEAFRGTAPINLTERLYQIVRWSGGSLEMFFSHNNPLFAGHRLHIMQRIAYINNNIYPVTSLFVLLYAFCPVMWLIPEEILIQKPFTNYVLYLIAIIALTHIIGIFEIKWAGNTWLDWWRNDQFFMIASLSAYPSVMLHMVVRLFKGEGIRFKVTSKQTITNDVDDDKFAELYEMRWVPMMTPVTVVFFSNIIAIGVAFGKAVIYGGEWSMARWRRGALGLLFNLWIMVLLQPFALAMLGRWSKKPKILFILLPLGFVISGLVYVGVHFFLVKFLPFLVI